MDEYIVCELHLHKAITKEMYMIIVNTFADLTTNHSRDFMYSNSA